MHDLDIKKQKLKLYRKDFRRKHRWIWICLFAALIISALASFWIADYTACPWKLIDIKATLFYAFCLFVNALGLGYVSGFTIYYLNEYRPKTLHLFEDIQKAIYIVSFIYEPARKLESIIFKDSDINSDNYVEEFRNKVTESCDDKNIVLIDEVVKYLKLIDVTIRFEEKNLYFLDNSIVTADLTKGISMLNIIKNIDGYNEVSGLRNVKNVRVEDLNQAIILFRKGIIYMEDFIKSVQKYFYVSELDNNRTVINN